MSEEDRGEELYLDLFRLDDSVLSLVLPSYGFYSELRRSGVLSSLSTLTPTQVSGWEIQ
jgi:hypothetical protein